MRLKQNEGQDRPCGSIYVGYQKTDIVNDVVVFFQLMPLYYAVNDGFYKTAFDVNITKMLL